MDRLSAGEPSSPLARTRSRKNSFPLRSRRYDHPGTRLGIGFFTVPLARLVGSCGRVIAVDLQPKMIESLKRRAANANVLDRVDARVTSAETMGIGDLEGKVAFTLAFAMVHEFPDAKYFFAEVARASKQNARVLLAEPRGYRTKRRRPSRDQEKPGEPCSSKSRALWMVFPRLAECEKVVHWQENRFEPI